MASLVIVEGPGDAAHFPLAEAIISVGRDDTCTFQVLDPLVSRKHLQVRFDSRLGKHVAGDYRSAHGVFVNNQKIVQDVPLVDGDRIRIGNTTLMYLTADHADAPSALAAAKKKDEWKRTTLLGHGS